MHERVAVSWLMKNGPAYASHMTFECNLVWIGHDLLCMNPIEI